MTDLGVSVQIQLGDRIVDLERALVRGPDGVVGLTDHEVALLGYLLANADRPVSREELLPAVWGLRADTVTRCVDTGVRRLRLKIEAEPAEPRHLLAVHGHGYRFVVVPPRPAAPPLAATATDLPAAPDLQGRDAWVARLESLVVESAVVRVLGPVGVGRTSLALAVAHRVGGAFPGGVWLGATGATDALVLHDDADGTWFANPRGRGEARLVLTPLDPADAAALLADRSRALGAKLDSAGISTLVTACGGLPAVLLRLADALTTFEPETAVSMIDIADLAARAITAVPRPTVRRWSGSAPSGPRSPQPMRPWCSRSRRRCSPASTSPGRWSRTAVGSRCRCRCGSRSVRQTTLRSTRRPGGVPRGSGRQLRRSAPLDGRRSMRRWRVRPMPSSSARSTPTATSRHPSPSGSPD